MATCLIQGIFWFATSINYMSEYNLLHSLKALTPQWVRDAIRNRLSVLGYDRAVWATSNPYHDDPPYSTYDTRCPYRIGIIEELSQRHHLYIRACREMKVAYRLIDISAPDWKAIVESSGCHGFLVWPTPILSSLKQMYDERIKVMTDVLGVITCPTFDEIWLYESKRRMHDWLDAHGIAHPRTWVFYDRERATSFIESVDYPLVFKTDFGACAQGVTIIYTRKEAQCIVDAAFSKGIKANRSYPSNRQIGNILFQEYVDVAKEWRMVRIGDSFFGHTKEKDGEFHSGSKKVGWLTPPPTHLDFLRQITETGGFRSMGVDVFETLDGRLLANELQTVFGASGSIDQMKVDGVVGRYIFNAHQHQWKFEAGDFARNACANLRVEALLSKIVDCSTTASSGLSKNQPSASTASNPQSSSI